MIVIFNYILALSEQSTKCKLKILYYLKEKKCRVPLTKISSDIGLSRNTVEKYLYELLSNCYETQEFRHLISIKKSSGAKINIDNQSAFIKFRNILLKNDVTIILYLRLLIGEEINEISFTNEFFISFSSYRRKLINIKKLVTSQGFQLQTYNGNCFLKGNENLIRLTATKVYWTLFQGQEWPFKNLSREYVMQLLSSLTSRSMSTRLNILSIEKIVLNLSINILRFRKGYNCVLPSELSKECYWIEKNIYKFFRDPPLNIKEIIYLFLTFLTAPRFSDNYFSADIFEYSKNKNSLLYEMSRDFIELSQQLFYLDTKQSNNLYPYVYACNISYFLNFTWMHHNDDVSLLNCFLTSKKNAEYMQKQIFDKNNLSNICLKKQQSLITNYQLIISTQCSLANFEPAINILLITDFGLLYENILKDYLHGLFKSLYNVEIYTDLSETENIDFIISTNKTPYLDNLFEDDKVIYIKEFPTIYEISLIRKRFDAFINDKRLNTNN